jgi:hypothetical protein
VSINSRGVKADDIYAALFLAGMLGLIAAGIILPHLNDVPMLQKMAVKYLMW